MLGPQLIGNHRRDERPIQAPTRLRRAKREVLVASATRVADAFVEQVDAGFSGADPETDLIVLAQAIVAHRVRFPEHFALVNSERLTNPEPGSPPSNTEIAANVHVFLHGYAKPSS